MRLAHLHLPGLTRYAYAQSIQERLVRRLLEYKASSASRTEPIEQPDPTVLTAESHPTYTCGRREINTLSSDQIEHLQADGRAEFHTAQRGGQTTYHGPGQLVAYPIIDLKRHGLSARRYIHEVLEEAVIGTCRLHGLETIRTGNPGVWVNEDAKIAAVGVHVRRSVTSHGVGLNVNNRVLPWFNRIVACGLEGKKITTLEQAVKNRQLAELFASDDAVRKEARVFVLELSRVLDGVDRVDEIAPVL